MTAYLLKSGLSLLLTLGFYKLWLENERLHRFKRAYLAGSLLFSALTPLIERWPAPLPLADAPPIESVERGLALTLHRVGLQPEPGDVGSTYWLWLYGIVTTVMLARFARNVYTLIRKATDNPSQPFRGATLVRLSATGLPYTFLHYLFVSAAAYQQGEIEDELFTHELAHIRQRHSLDVLLVEFLLCFGWFNPLLGWFKQAIQLNHEFLADEAVNMTHQNVTHYQRLLLSKLIPTASVRLTSTLLFQTTKQRFIMMTKHTTRAKLGLVGGGSALLFGTLTVLITTSVPAQVTPPASPTATHRSPVRQPQPEVAEMERLYGNKLVHVPGRPNEPKSFRRRYSDLTDAEKKLVIYIPPQPQKSPTEAEFIAWKNPRKYGIWVDGRRTRNFVDTPLQATDIISYSGSFVHKNARQPEGYLYQMDLMTRKGYDDYMKEQVQSPLLILRKDHVPTR
ncbi:MAG: hypothetical protein H7Z72_03970 [Bacteroidetes bacterium]|nr:hypothetical protein [Fibrella sp.]